MDPARQGPRARSYRHKQYSEPTPHLLPYLKKPYDPRITMEWIWIQIMGQQFQAKRWLIQAARDIQMANIRPDIEIQVHGYPRSGLLAFTVINPYVPEAFRQNGAELTREGDLVLSASFIVREPRGLPMVLQFLKGYRL